MACKGNLAWGLGGLALGALGMWGIGKALAERTYDDEATELRGLPRFTGSDVSFSAGVPHWKPKRRHHGKQYNRRRYGGAQMHSIPEYTG